jgi:hypothetical protein
LTGLELDVVKIGSESPQRSETNPRGLASQAKGPAKTNLDGDDDQCEGASGHNTARHGGALIRPDIPRGRIMLKSEPLTLSPSEEPPMTVQDFVVQRLTTFNIAADGTRLRMNFISGDGDHACLSLPTECLTELIMTLPLMMRQALRARHQDESLRLVYPADKLSIEQSSDPRTIIVTLATPDGFEVSFGLTRQQLTVFDAAVEALERGGPDIQSTVSN